MQANISEDEDDNGEPKTPEEAKQWMVEVERSNMPQHMKSTLLNNLKFLLEILEKKQKEVEKREDDRATASLQGYPFPERDAMKLHLSFQTPDMKSGEPCPHCNKKLHQRPSLRYDVIDASPLMVRYRVECEVLRCASCDAIFHAPSPDFLAPESMIGRYTPRAVAAIAMRRFLWGMPNMRQEMISDIEGGSLPRSTQHDLLEEGRERLRPILEHIYQESANAKIRCLDDRAFKILQEKAAIDKEITNAVAAGKRKEDVRHGIHSTVVVSETADNHRLVLVDTSRAHQGNVEFELNQLRTADGSIICTSDLSKSAKKVAPMPTKNAHGYTPVAKKSKKIDATPSDTILRVGCWTHVLLHITDAKDAVPEDQKTLIELIQKIFEHDARTQELTSTARLEYHQKNTQQDVEAFFALAEPMAQDPRAESNGLWGNALSYVIENKEHLTLFLRIAGTHLHTNHVEATHLVQVRHENNSQHYQTILGAQIGDAFQSLALTARENDANPLHWITACLEHCTEIALEPADWMPWTYLETLTKLHATKPTKCSYRPAKKRAKRVIRVACGRTSQEKSVDGTQQATV
jgi:transposase